MTRELFLARLVLLVLVLLGGDLPLACRRADTPIVVVGLAYNGGAGPDLPLRRHGRDGVLETRRASSSCSMSGWERTTACCSCRAHRKELRTREDKQTTRCSVTVRRVGPAIPGQRPDGDRWPMLVLLVAEVGSVHTLGPVAAIGVFCVLLAGLTILPALLTISGRRGFWPRQPLVAPSTPQAAATQRPGVWRAHRRPRPAQARSRRSSSPWPSSASGRSACSPTTSTTARRRSSSSRLTAWTASR